MAKTVGKKSLMKLVQTENERIIDLLVNYDVPDSIEDIDLNNYLLPSDKNAAAKNATASKSTPSASIDELQERLNTIKNKMKTKKRPTSERAVKKREAKKLKKNKEFKKVLVSAAKSIKNETHKLTNGDGSSSARESKADIKPVMPKTVYNEEGKIVFSKFDFASHPGAKVKKSHQNPREILKKIKDTDKKIHELKEQGDTEKVAQMKTDIAWKKAFDKIEGKKVKDDPKLLYKALKKRKEQKKKTKKEWTDRKEKVEAGINQRQKKRQENLDKRSKDKKNRKLKKASKKGRVVPGF